MCVLIVSAFSYGLSFVHRPNKCFRFSIRECCLIFLANKKDILLFVNVAVSTKYAMCVHLQRLLYFTVIISIQNNYQLCDSLGSGLVPGRMLHTEVGLRVPYQVPLQIFYYYYYYYAN